MNDAITLMDGASGTCLWQRAGDTKPVWTYNITKPELVCGLHRDYIAAGSKLILTNTFCANALAVDKEGFGVGEVVRAGVRAARKAAAGTDVRVGLDVGPLTSLLAPFGEISHERAHEIYREQILSGMEEGPDCIILETFMDLEMISIALAEARASGVPVICSMSFTKFGKTIMGNKVEKIAARLEAEGACAVGLNCSLGPDAALPIIKQFAACTALPLVFKPNAGLPGEDGESGIGPDGFASSVMRAVEAGASYVGGCCGTSPAYIQKLKELLEAR